LITDLDNTLWDWFEAWYSAFSVMLGRLSEMSGVPESVLEGEIKRVHEERGTAEYPNLVNELPSLRETAGQRSPEEVYGDALHRFYSTRKKATGLYPGVAETLDRLRRMGVMIVGYTESVPYPTEWRIKRTGLDGVIDVLYSAEEHGLPPGVTVASLRRYPPEYYGLRITQHRHVPEGATKPSPEVLRWILAECGRRPEEAVYVGDNLMKDVAMAQTVGVLDAHAKYGEVQSRPEYDLLRRVTHWPEATVAREQEVVAKNEVIPTVTLNQFSDVLALFAFKAALA
jgi:phosphoglycolate phosphatase